MSEWWLSRGDGKTEGPLSTRALVDGLVAGDIPKRSHVCMVGQQQWHLVSQVEEIWEAVDPSESSTSVTETPWFVDRTDSGKHKLLDAEVTGDEQTKLMPPNGLGTRPRAAKPEVADVKFGPSGSLPERRPDAQTVKQIVASSNPVSAATSRPSHAPPVPKRGSAEATPVKPGQQPAQVKPSQAPPLRARNSPVNSPAPLTSSAPAPRSSIASDAALQSGSAVPTNPYRTEAAPRASVPDLGGGSRPSSPGPLAAGLTPLGLKAQEPLLAAARPFAGLAGLSPLPGAVTLPNSRQQSQTPHHGSPSPERSSGALTEPSKPALAEPSRPFAPPASRNLYGASPLSGARERAATLERRAPSPPSVTPFSAQPAGLSRATSSPRPEPPSTDNPVGRVSGTESGVTIQPIIALAGAPNPKKVEHRQPRSQISSSSFEGLPVAATEPVLRAPITKTRTAESPLLQVAEPRAPSPSDYEADEDDATRSVAARPAMASAILESKRARPELTPGAPTLSEDPTETESEDEATTLLQARVEPNRPGTEPLHPTTRGPAQLGDAQEGDDPRNPNLAALAEAHALGPESIVADPNQLLADVDDDAGPPAIPIVQLPMVAPRALPASAPPFTAATVSAGSPSSAPPTALAAPPSTPPPAHNPRLSVPTIVLKPEPIVHQEATQPAVRALRKRSPFRLSYGSLIGLLLAVVVVSVAAYLFAL